MVDATVADRVDDQHRALALAVVFGVVSVPWTYGFALAPSLPLWPSFIASATYFSTGKGWAGLGRGLAGNLAGAGYALAALAAVRILGWSVAGLSLAVGVGMLLAGLHAFVDALSFTPAGFFGYATLFSVDAAGITLGQTGLVGVGLATAVSFGIGALIGLAADGFAGFLAKKAGSTL